MKDLYKFLKKQENQGVYVINFFNAAGCAYFTLPKLKTQRTTNYLENERHFVKDRSVQLIKDKFPNQIDIEGLAKYLEEEIKDDCIKDCMSHFGVPTAFDEDKMILAKALAYQFQLFVEADSEDIDNDVAKEFEKLKNGNDVSISIRRSAANNGDDYWVERKGMLQVDCYKSADYTWVIHNAGSVYWTGRKLVLINEKTDNPRPKDKVIPIPDVEPNGYIKIATSFEARSMEGRFLSEWEMQDSQGTSCFGINTELNVIINVSYRINTEG